MRIAVVGNGPLSTTDREEIELYDKVVRFNNMRNWEKGERFDILAMRQNFFGGHIFAKMVNVGVFIMIGFLIILNILAVVYSGFPRKKIGYHGISCLSLTIVVVLLCLEVINQVQTNSTPTIMDYPPEDAPSPQEIVVFGVDSSIINLVQKEFPKTTVHFQEINNKNVEFVNQTIKYDKSIDGPTTGFHMLSYLTNRYPNDKLHIYGMNWNFRMLGSMAHDGNIEKYHVYNTCHQCVVHPTPTDNYDEGWI